MQKFVKDPEARFEELISALKHKGCRITPQRLELVRMIAASKTHPNASELFESIKNQFPTMSQATVYNTLSLLKDLGQVLEIDLHGDSHYDGNHPEPHPHVICMKCNKIVDGDLELDTESIQRLEENSGFQILRSQLAFYGICPDCRSTQLNDE